MALVLSIETSTSNCSVALHNDGKCIAKRDLDKLNIHASHTFIFMNEVMEESKLKFQDLSAVAVSKGPGSYTGLRIGTSAAKGICYSCNIPLIAVNTLQVLTLAAIEKVRNISSSTAFVPMIDARRMEVYCAVLDKDLQFIQETNAKIVDAKSFEDLSETELVFFWGWNG